MSRRRTWLWRVVVVVVAALVTTALAARGVEVPALTLVVVVATGLAAGPVPGALTGLVGGWALDLVPPGAVPLGLAALTHALAGHLAGRATRVAGWPLWWPGVVAGGGWVVVSAPGTVRALTTGAPTDWPGLVVGLLLTALTAVVLTPAILAVDRRLAGRRAR